MNSVLNKLRQLKSHGQAKDAGVIRQHISRTRVGLAKGFDRGACQSLEDIAEFEKLEDGLYRIRKTFPIEGGRALTIGSMMPYLDSNQVDPAHLVFIDTETNGLGTASGTIAFMIGILKIIGNNIHVEQFLISRYSAEKAMLQYLIDCFAKNSILVSYNGKQFDVPLLQARLRLAGLDYRFDQHQHIDLLYPVRLAFSGLWSGCGLQVAEQRLLGVYRDDDLPGSEAPRVWFEFLRQGKTADMIRLLTHNFQDLHSLALLIFKLDQIYLNPSEFVLDRARIARRKVRENRLEEACSLLMKSENTPEKLLLAEIYRGMGRWQNAVEIWSSLAREGCQQSILALAKYYEHRQKDFAQATTFSLQLYGLSPCTAHARRLERLGRRLRSASLGPLIAKDSV